MPYLVLPSHHFAASWSGDREIRDYDTVTNAGIKYVKETNLDKKEALLLELIRFFHSYIFKYTSMVISGVVPKTGNTINYDAKQLLRLFLPAGVKPNGMNLSKVARTLNVAFKGMEVEEVYNIMCGCLIKALQKYDPDYVKKMKEVIEAINSLNGAPFTSKQITKLVDFQAMRICKKLIARGNLVKVEESNGEKSAQMVTASWPPDEKLVNSGPIGLPYFVSCYFRRYLQQYITNEMKSVEAKSIVSQIETNLISEDQNRGLGESRIRSSVGKLKDTRGRTWHADVDLMNSDQDTGVMSLEWVNSCSNPLFEDLSKKERMFLYLLYTREMKKTEICKTLGISSSNYMEFQENVLNKVREKAKVSGVDGTVYIT